jgi:DnaJ-class molecular chaperone
VNTSLMQVDRGFSRNTAVMCEVDLSSGIAGQISCIECGGDGDWTKFYPEPETLTEPLHCVECKGTGRVWVSA